MKISYECSELIEELKSDIKEFGDVEMYAFFKKINGYVFLIDYDFADSNTPKNVEDTTVQILKASKILEILNEQNKII